MRRKLFGTLLLALSMPIALQAEDIAVVKTVPVVVGEHFCHSVPRDESHHSGRDDES